MSLRDQIVAEIMTLVRQQPKKMERPTIDELEKIINSESSDAVNIEPDGSVTVTPTVTTVGAVADKVTALVETQIAYYRDGLTNIAQAAKDQASLTWIVSEAEARLRGEKYVTIPTDK